MKEIKFDIEYDHSNGSNETAKLLVLEGNFNYKQQIKDILENFDFERVHESMLALYWHYSDYLENKPYIPEIQELKNTARHCLEHAVKCQFSETGGFLAVHSGGVLNLYFVLEGTINDFTDLKDVTIYEKHLNKEKILKKLKHG